MCFKRLYPPIPLLLPVIGLEPQTAAAHNAPQSLLHNASIYAIAHRIPRLHIHLDAVIVKDEVDITRTKLVRLYELGISRRSLVLGVACEHALDADTYALHVMNR